MVTDLTVILYSIFSNHQLTANVNVLHFNPIQIAGICSPNPSSVPLQSSWNHSHSTNQSHCRGTCSVLQHNETPHCVHAPDSRNHGISDPLVSSHYDHHFGLQFGIETWICICTERPWPNVIPSRIYTSGTQSVCHWLHSHCTIWQRVQRSTRLRTSRIQWVESWCGWYGAHESCQIDGNIEISWGSIPVTIRS